MDDIKYLAIVWDDDGDRWESVHDTPEAANHDAASKWEHLTPRERERTHVYACLVRRERLSEDAVDEDTGAIDWSLFEQADGFPGAFDSEEADSLLATAKRWGQAEVDGLPRIIHPDRVHFDLRAKRWLIAAEVNYKPIELTLAADGSTTEVMT